MKETDFSSKIDVFEVESPLLVAQYAYGGTSDGVEDPCIHDDNPSN